VFVSTNYHALVRARRYYIELSENSSRKANLQNFIRVTRFATAATIRPPHLPPSNAERTTLFWRLTFERENKRDGEKGRMVTDVLENEEKLAIKRSRRATNFCNRSRIGGAPMSGIRSTTERERERERRNRGSCGYGVWCRIFAAERSHASITNSNNNDRGRKGLKREKRRK